MGLEVLFERSWPTLVARNDARFNLRGDNLFASHGDRMLAGGDFDLNSVQRYTDSLMEVLKQTMLKHEDIFRRQVHELHRLYRMQKTLMEDHSWKEFNRYTSWTASVQSTLIPFQDPSEYKPLEEDKTFSTWKVEEGQGTFSKPQQRPFDIQLPANDYINHVAMELPHKGNLQISFRESMKVNRFIYNNHIPDPEEVKLALSTGKDSNKKGSTGRVLYNKQCCLPVEDVIDLEKSTGWVSNEEKPLSSNSKAPITYDEDKRGSQITSPTDSDFSGRARKDPGGGLFRYCSLEDNSGSFQDLKSFSLDTGLNECHGSSSSVSLSSRKQQSILYDKTDLDLNRIQLDESSCVSGAHAVTFPSQAASSSGVLQGIADGFHKRNHTVVDWWNKVNNSCSNESSNLLQQDNALYSTMTDSRKKYTSTQASARSTKAKSGSEVGLIDLESVPEDSSEKCEDFGSQVFRPGEENLDSPLGRQCGVFHNDTQMDSSDVIISSKLEEKLDPILGCTDLPQTAGNVEVGKVSYEKSDEDTVSSSPYQSRVVVQTVHHENFPAASKFDWVTDNNLINIKYLHSGTEDKQKVKDLNLSAFECETTQLGSQFTETHSCEHDPIVQAGVYGCLQDESSKVKDMDCDELQHGTTEIDELIQKAAETLIDISFENSDCSQDLFANAGSEELANEQGNNQPQYSSDSFESIVLRQKESSVDDCSVTSGLMEVMETENVSGVKLRRGRRLKDFQRDILPGLVSLSRHEICEDIHSFGGVIKSNEFRKNRSKKTNVENWCVPMRRRRSRFYYDG